MTLSRPDILESPAPLARCVSLFTGCGGLDLGLSRAGFQIVFANDLEPKAKASYENLFGSSPHYLVSSVADLKPTEVANQTASAGEIDLLAGGPPCPPYSKSRFYRRDKPRSLNDPVADETLRGYVSMLDALKPKAFLFENVAGFAYRVHPEGHAFLKEAAQRAGYQVADAVLNAADYGVPQIRQRFFMVGTLQGKFEFPNPTHADPKSAQKDLFSQDLEPWVTAGEAIGDLDTGDSQLEGHFAGGKHHDLLREVPPGDNYLYFTEKRGHPEPRFEWRSRYWSFLLKLSPALPSWTIQARRSNNMGPFHWRNRILTIEEVKRLQTFPDDWDLAGTTEQQWRQVGNAVPPLLGEVLGRALLSHLHLTRSVPDNATSGLTS